MVQEKQHAIKIKEDTFKLINQIREMQSFNFADDTIIYIALIKLINLENKEKWQLTISQ